MYCKKTYIYWGKKNIFLLQKNIFLFLKKHVLLWKNIFLFQKTYFYFKKHIFITKKHIFISKNLIENMKGKHDASIRRYIRVAKKEADELKSQPKVEIESPVNPTQKVDRTLGELEHEIDVFIEAGCKSDFLLTKYALRLAII